MFNQIVAEAQREASKSNIQFNNQGMPVTDDQSMKMVESCRNLNSIESLRMVKSKLVLQLSSSINKVSQLVMMEGL